MSRPPLADSRLPVLELATRQGGSCAACKTALQKCYTASEGRSGRILAVLCKACVDGRRAFTPVKVPALLGVRLTPVSVRTGLRPYDPLSDASALLAGDWAHLANPAQALWSAQKGRCAATGHSPTSFSALTVDAAPGSGLVLGLLCMTCRCAEGKNKGAAARRWAAYRRHPLGQTLLATRGLTRAFMTRAATR